MSDGHALAHPSPSRLRAFLLPGLAVYAALGALHLGVGLVTQRLPAHDLTTSFDRATPFVPAFAWIYATYWLMPFLPLFFVRDLERFHVTLLASVVATSTASVVFLVFPVNVPDPELGASLSEHLMAIILIFDSHTRVNNLPSLHVATACIVAYACTGQGLRRSTEILILGQCFLIALSTLFVKQHVIVDVLLGFVWAIGSWKVAAALYARLQHRALARKSP